MPAARHFATNSPQAHAPAHMKPRASRLAPVARMAVVAGCTLSMVGATFPAAAFAAQYLWVDNVGYGEGSEAFGEGWSWDGDLDLQLNGYNSGDIWANGALEVTLTGENTITQTDPSADGLVTYDDGEGVSGLTITGTEGSSLTITGEGNVAIGSKGDIDIVGADITVDGFKTGVYTFDNDGDSVFIEDSTLDLDISQFGIYGSEDVVIADSEVSVDGYTVVGICAAGAVEITGSDVQVGEQETPGHGWGIYAGDYLDIESSEVSVSTGGEDAITSQESDVIIEGSSVVVDVTGGHGIIAQEGTVSATDSDLEVVSWGATAVLGDEVLFDSSNVTVAYESPFEATMLGSAVEGEQVTIQNGSDVSVEASYYLSDTYLYSDPIPGATPAFLCGIAAVPQDNPPTGFGAIEVSASNLVVNVEVSEDFSGGPELIEVQSVQEGAPQEAQAVREEPSSKVPEYYGIGISAMGADEGGTVLFEGSTADITAPDIAVFAYGYSSAEDAITPGTITIEGAEVTNHDGDPLYIVPVEETLEYTAYIIENPEQVRASSEMPQSFTTVDYMKGQALATAPSETPVSLRDSSLSPDAVIKVVDPKPDPAPEPTPVNPDVPSLPATSDASADGAGVLAGGGIMALLSGLFLALARRTRPAGAHWA